MRKYLILIPVLAVALSACRVESIMSLDIDADGSAVVGVELGFDEEFRQLMGEAGGDPADLMSDLPDLGDGDVTQTERTEGDMTYVGFEAQVDDLSSFDTDALGQDAFTSFSYTFDDDTAALDANLSSAGLGEAEGDLPIDPSQITDEFFSATIVVNMPGTVSQSNADEVRSDGALVWDLPITGGDVHIEATSDIGGGGTSTLFVIVIALLAGLAILAIIVATVMNRRRPERAVAAAAERHEISASTPQDDAPTDGLDSAADEPVDGTSPPPEDDAGNAGDQPAST